MAAYTISRFKVKDFGHFKRSFDEREPFRKKNGQKMATVIQVEGDPNDIVLIASWPSIEVARKYYALDELREIFKEAGLVGKPRVIYGEEPVTVSASTSA